jgi:hypothetical protein
MEMAGATGNSALIALLLILKSTGERTGGLRK